VAGDGADPGGEFRAVAEQRQAAVGADKGFLGSFFRQRGVAQAAPGDGIDAALVTLDQLAVARDVALAHGGDGLLVLDVGGNRFGRWQGGGGRESVHESNDATRMAM
jgi:hypothetical protein